MQPTPMILVLRCNMNYFDGMSKDDIFEIISSIALKAIGQTNGSDSSVSGEVTRIDIDKVFVTLNGSSTESEFRNLTGQTLVVGDEVIIRKMRGSLTNAFIDKKK